MRILSFREQQIPAEKLIWKEAFIKGTQKIRSILIKTRLTYSRRKGTPCKREEKNSSSYIDSHTDVGKERIGRKRKEEGELLCIGERSFFFLGVYTYSERRGRTIWMPAFFLCSFFQHSKVV
ncbi:hypothetical protein MKC66_10410 [[Clostridium] innocuum]|nr:hypothetical protein [Erysipelotrichaceae bacterium]MCR0205130.1 hypothetical protein [[Clostridium] innocuum]MCR0623061.1 hypothetical protein [[Clostridium] innocuum]